MEHYMNIGLDYWFWHYFKIQIPQIITFYEKLQINGIKHSQNLISICLFVLELYIVIEQIQNVGIQRRKHFRTYYYVYAYYIVWSK